MSSSRTARRRRRADRRRKLLRASGKVPPDLRLECDLPVEFVAAAGDGEQKVRRFKMTAYSGGTMRPRGFYRDAVLDLQGVKLMSGKRPVFLNHQPDQIVGHTEQIELASNRITAEGLVSGAGDAAEEVIAASDNGFPWRASVGGDIQETEFVAEGQAVLVNGRRFRGPLIVIRKATIAEISFVPLAGDDRTNAKIAASRNTGEFSVDFEKWLQARGFDADALSEEQLKHLRADYQAEQRRLEARRTLAEELDRLIADRTTDERPREKVLEQLAASSGLSGETCDQLLEASIDLPAEVSRKDLLEAARNLSPARREKTLPDGGDEYRKKLAAEERRADRIRKLCADYGEPTVKLEGGEEVSLRAHAIEQNWTLEKVELHAMRNSRPRGPGIHTTDRTPRAGVLEAALCLSVHLPEKIVASGLTEQEMDQATSRQARQAATLHALMDAVILAAGGYYSGNRKSNDFIRAALRAERQLMAGREYSSLQASGGFSTISLSGILGNVANKAMLAAYEAVDVVHPMITAPRNQTDFKVWTRYRLDSTGAFQKVGADGELKHVGLDEASYTNQLDTYGAIIALTRQMQINDDLDAFMQIPTILGRMSAVRLEEAVFVLLLSNPSSFFSTGNRNYFDGATSALSIDSLTTAEQKFRDQVDSNGKPILIPPKVLLTGTTDAVTAKELYDETKVDVTTTANKRQFASNPHAGKYTPAASPYINNTAITDSDGNAITGQSDTQWYLFADPAVRAAMGVATLNGQRVPTIESSETPFDSLGMQWRAFHDFGVGMEDTVGAVKSKGAA